MFSRYVCLLVRSPTPDLDGYRASLTLRDPENCEVPLPKYEAAALQVHLSTGYPNSTNGQCAHGIQQHGRNVSFDSYFSRYVSQDMLACFTV